jgi:hypothetical protein
MIATNKVMQIHNNFKYGILCFITYKGVRKNDICLCLKRREEL